MQVIRKFVCVIGVALCAAPIFSPLVFAQQGNEQARVLLQMQAMRQEIAELRDMIERQGYELQRLKRSSNSPSANNQAIGAVGSLPAEGSFGAEGSTNAQGFPPSVEGAPSASNFPDSANTVPSANNPQYPASGTQAPTSDAEFYQPYPGDSNAASVEERVIQAPSVANGAQDGRPPIEERIIGGTGQVVEQPQISQPSFPPTVNNTNIPQPNATAGSTANPASTGVIAVPNAPPSATPAQGAVNAGQVPTAPAVGQEPIANQVPAVNQTPVANQQQVATTQPSQPALGESDYYQQGFNLLKQSKHKESVDIFKQQIDSYPQGDLVDDAHYWIAESMYVNRSLDMSKQYFKLIIDNYPQSPRVPDAMLKTAYIEQEQGNQIEARILLQEIIQFHPRSNAAISAKNRLADLG